jgi:predicted nucleotidyltransferase
LKRIQDKKLKNFIDQLRKRFGRNLKKIILFGSRARGDHTDESDYDFILIFEEVSPEVKDKLDDLCLKMLLEHDMVITDFAFTEKDLERKRYEPFIMNAKREGMFL